MTDKSLLSKFRLGGGGGDHEKVRGRSPLSKAIKAALAEQFPSLADRDLSAFTFEKHRSKQAGARDDFAIYDAADALCYEGRSFNSGSISFWKHTGG